MFQLFWVKRVKPIFLIAILSVLLRAHAKPYPDSPNSIIWTFFLTPSQHNMSSGDDYEKNWDAGRKGVGLGA